MGLDGKVAYVTGGGQGIGRAFCHALGEAGAKVAVADLVLAKAEAVACELRLKGIKSIAIAADVSRPEDVQRMLATIVDKWGTVHIACNNAGINMNSPSEATSLEEWDKTFNVNLRGLFLCCQVRSVQKCPRETSPPINYQVSQWAQWMVVLFFRGLIKKQHTFFFSN
uniref:Uncharacterized protein n=1 Tax=Podarcis muralis TaxID=64176 RepID=A0A670JGF1_PODMU